MKKRFATSFLAILLLMAAVAPAITADAVSAPTTSKSIEVEVDNFTFAPETITVPANATVTWLNRDDVPHVIASTDGLFRSKALDTDDKYAFTFTKPGTYSYFCAVHPKMVGKIIVR
jgi:plastocyanin